MTSKTLPPLLALVVASLAWRCLRRRAVRPFAPASPASPATAVFERSPEVRHPYTTGLDEAAGVIGAGADTYLRALLVDLLTHDDDNRVVTTADDLNRIFEGQFDLTLRSAFLEQLYVADLLEDAIEHLETEADRSDIAQPPPSIYWFATPGADSDVVHQTIQRWHGRGLVALLSGPWPYGPTHQLDHDMRALAPGRSAGVQPMSSTEAITLLRRLTAM